VIALFGLLMIVTMSIIVVRIGAIALELTGMASEMASFQAQSAFSGTGFTTSEAESVVTHPVRRKIIRILILFGSAGFTSSVAAVILTFVGYSEQSIAARIAVLSLGLIVIFMFAQSKMVYRFMKVVIVKMLRQYTSLRVIDYQEVLGLSQGYTVSRFMIKKDNWMAGHALKDLQLHQEGVLILSILRHERGKERFIGGATGETVLKAGDILICYGKSEASKNLAERPKGREGDKEHNIEVKKEQLVIEDEKGQK